MEVHPTLRRSGVVRSLYGRRVEEKEGLASARNGKKSEVRFAFPSSFINIRAGKRYLVQLPGLRACQIQVEQVAYVIDVPKAVLVLSFSVFRFPCLSLFFPCP